MSADQDISQNSRKAKHNGPDVRLSDRNRRETGIISYHHAVLRNLTAYFALGGVIVGLRPARSSWLARMGAPQALVFRDQLGEDAALQAGEAVRGHHQTFPQQPALCSLAACWKATNWS
jgi:hypothetical protein